MQMRKEIKKTLKKKSVTLSVGLCVTELTFSNASTESRHVGERCLYKRPVFTAIFFYTVEAIDVEV